MQLSTRTHHVRSSAGSRSLRCTPIIRASHPRCHLRCQVSMNIVCCDGSLMAHASVDLSRAWIYTLLASICTLAGSSAARHVPQEQPCLSRVSSDQCDSPTELSAAVLSRRQ